MFGLLIETATKRCVVSVGVGREVLHSIQLPFGYMSSVELLPAIQRMMADSKTSLESVDHIAVGTGPGSYTGIRVGLAAAQGLSIALSVPIVPVCSMTGWIPDVSGSFAVAIDARGGGVYLRQGMDQQFGGEAQLVPIEEVSARLEGVPTIVCPEVAPLQRRLPDLVFVENGPCPSRMQFEAHRAFQAGEYPSDGAIEPSYLRPGPQPAR